MLGPNTSFLLKWCGFFTRFINFVQSGANYDKEQEYIVIIWEYMKVKSLHFGMVRKNGAFRGKNCNIMEFLALHICYFCY